MKLYTLLLTSALFVGITAPAAFADAPEGVVVAQAKTKNRRVRKAVAKKKLKKKAARKAAPMAEVTGDVQVGRGKKGALKTVHVVTAEGKRMPVMLNPKARKMAKLGGKMAIKGKVITRKGVEWLRPISFVVVPEPKPEPEVEAVEPKVAEKPVEAVTPAPAVADEPPADDDGAMDNDGDAPSDNDPPMDALDDAPSDDDGDSNGVDDGGDDN